MHACKMYGIPPSQLDEEDYHRVERHRLMEQAEDEYRRRDAADRAKRGRRGRK